MIDTGERRLLSDFSARDTALRGEREVLRLVIADQHQLFRDCLASVLAEDQRFEVVGKVASGREALDRLRETQVDILLVALEPSVDGIWGLIREVEERSPFSKVVLLGRDDPEERVLDLMQAGACGYLVRDQSLADLQSAIEAVSRGDTVCTRRIAHFLCERLARMGRERRRAGLDHPTLTPRELLILSLTAEDLSNREIARRLFLSVHTVKNHLHKALETLGVHSRRAAIRHAVERGWIQDRRRR